jgi:hypothetical protein
MVLAMLLFWKGYEEGNVKAKIWFGCVLALSVLARYTTIWLIPTLLIYFIIRDKSLKFVLDGKFWLSVLVFFVTLSPWMIYGVFTYNNPFGFLIHSFIGSTYYAPNYQPWYFYLAESLDMFSIVFVLFLIGLIWIVHTKVYRNREMYFVLLWCLSIVVFTSAMSFKEQRFLLPMVPALCLIAGWSLSQLHYLKKLIIGLVIFGLLASFALHYHKEYIDTHTGTFQCFLEANQFLKNVEKDALVISDESPYVYYYSRHRVAYFPSSRNLSDLDLSVQEISQRQPVYVFYTDWDMTLLKEENARFYDKLEARYPRVFTCAKGKGLAVVYSYKE